MTVVDGITNGALLLGVCVILYQRWVIRQLRDANCIRAEEALTGYTTLNGYTLPAPDHPGWSCQGDMYNGDVRISAVLSTVEVNGITVVGSWKASKYVRAVRHATISAAVVRSTS